MASSSQYNMHDAITADCVGDDEFYDGDDDSDYRTDDDNAFNSEGDSVLSESSQSGSQKNYTVLKGEDIRRRQEDDVTEVSSLLSIPRESARLLLRHYFWSVNSVHEEWFADEEKVRKAVGLLLINNNNPTAARFSSEEELITCGICFDEFSSEMITTTGCDHPFCRECWRGYITTSIMDGPGCLWLRCPDTCCGVAVDKVMIDELLVFEEEFRKKYYDFMIRSYVEGNRKIKWCPAPNCEMAVEFELGSGSYDVICGCCNGFCWNCTEDAHRPVDCDTVAKWMLKKSAEAESTKWIFAYTKPCPLCKRPIEKNQGCMHMTCSAPCRYSFCWLCLSPWGGSRCHGNCNRYEEDKEKMEAKEDLKRYTHYYERWATNQLSREKAQRDLQNMENVEIMNLSKIQQEPETQLKFILDAWGQIVECRRVLKWTYAYGFYLSDHQNEEATTTKKAFFEYLQGEAETGLERLHQCAEMESSVFFREEVSSDEFNKYRVKLIELTNVTKNYFENLVRALENGLADVYSSESRRDKKTDFFTGDFEENGKEYVAFVDSDGQYYYLSN